MFPRGAFDRPPNAIGTQKKVFKRERVFQGDLRPHTHQNWRSVTLLEDRLDLIGDNTTIFECRSSSESFRGHFLASFVRFLRSNFGMIFYNF